MKKILSKAALSSIALLAFASASADYGVGVKAGSLGLGIEGRWNALPWLDVRLGGNTFDYEDTGAAAGVNYDATFGLESFYATGNFRFPLSPFRATAGVVSNGNELRMASVDTATFTGKGWLYAATRAWSVSRRGPLPGYRYHFGSHRFGWRDHGSSVAARLAAWK